MHHVYFQSTLGGTWADMHATTLCSRQVVQWDVDKVGALCVIFFMTLANPETLNSRALLVGMQLTPIGIPLFLHPIML